MKREKKKIINRIKDKLNSALDVSLDEVKDFFAFGGIFSELKKTGILRYKKNSINSIINLSKFLLTNKNDFSLVENEIKYINSVIEFKSVEIRRQWMINKIKEELRFMNNNLYYMGANWSLIPTLCAYLEYTLILKRERNHIVKESTETKEMHLLENYSIEEIVDAGSYVISVYKEMFKDEEFYYRVFHEHVNSKRLKQIISYACQIRYFEQSEMLIEVLNYDLYEKDGIKILKPPIDIIGKIYRQGYIQSNLATMNKSCKIQSEDKSFGYEDIKNMLQELDIQEYVNDKRYPRYRMLIPEILLTESYKVDELLKEENFWLLNAIYELEIEYKKLDINVYKNISLMEFIRFRRVFIILYLIHQKKLYEKYKNKEISFEVFINSIISILPLNTLYSTFKKYESKIKDFIDMLICPSNKVLDLYYQPILLHNDEIIVMNGIMYDGSPFRNLVVLLKKNSSSLLNADGSDDLLINYVSKELTQKNIKNYVNIQIGNSSRILTDIDLCFILDSKLYIVECKNAYHPTDMYEIRNTIDYINKAQEQLKIISNYFSNDINKKKFCNNLNIDVNLEIACFVITGNRIMSNNNIYNYPIRYCHEFINFITNGKIVIGKEGDFNLWQSDKITSKDMDNYLSESFKPFGIIMNSFQEIKRINKLDSKIKLLMVDYAMNIELAEKYCKENFNRNVVNNEILCHLKESE